MATQDMNEDDPDESCHEEDATIASFKPEHKSSGADSICLETPTHIRKHKKDKSKDKEKDKDKEDSEKKRSMNQSIMKKLDALDKDDEEEMKVFNQRILCEGTN